jgi:hypothetical protein
MRSGRTGWWRWSGCSGIVSGIPFGRRGRRTWGLRGLARAGGRRARGAGGNEGRGAWGGCGGGKSRGGAETGLAGAECADHRQYRDVIEAIPVCDDCLCRRRFGDDGVHNVLEAAVYGKPVVFGPVIEKYIEAVELTESGGGIVIDSALEAERVFERLLRDPGGVRETGEASARYVDSKKGATDQVYYDAKNVRKVIFCILTANDLNRTPSGLVRKSVF